MCEYRCCDLPFITSCNDRLFPSTSQARLPGDSSFAPRQLQRGCCGSDDHEDTPYHDGAFEPQVLLIDAGCEWLDYASDITRTIPIGNGGKYTEKGGQIYEAVLRMQKVGPTPETANIRNARHWSDPAFIGIYSIFTRIGC